MGLLYAASDGELATTVHPFSPSFLQMVLPYLSVVLLFSKWKKLKCFFNNACSWLFLPSSESFHSMEMERLSSWRSEDRSLCHSKCMSAIFLLSDIKYSFFSCPSLLIPNGWFAFLTATSTSGWCFHVIFCPKPKTLYFSSCVQLRDHPFIRKDKYQSRFIKA